MSETKPFQIIFISVCIVLTVAGVFVFSFGGAKRDSSKDFGPEVVIWGTEDEEQFNDIIRSANGQGAGINATYIQKEETSFRQDVLEALATGNGPDVILTEVEDVLTYQDKITVIPFETLSERDFRDSFIEQGELFKTQEGFSAIPFSVDPLVLYWNRDIFTIHDKTNPPTKWDTVVSLVPEMRDISEDLTVFEAVVSLGDYRNITNAKAILTALMLQSGTPITVMGYRESEEALMLSSYIGSVKEGSVLVPASAAVNFYTQFADPLSKQYTWNRALPASLEMFVSDDLAMYIGYGSESDLIRSKNPNLNFDMALLPQSGASPTPITFGKMKGLAILSSSENVAGSYRAITALSGPIFGELYAEATGLPPVRRDLLATPKGDAFSAVLYKSALYSRGFLDPNPTKTDSIFQTMIESVLSGRLTASEAVRNGDNQFQLLINEFNLKQQQ